MLSPRTSSRRMAGVMARCCALDADAPAAATRPAPARSLPPLGCGPPPPVPLLAVLGAGSHGAARHQSPRRPPAAASTARHGKLTIWSWATNIDQIVAIWNTAHPDIQVSVNSVAQGDAHVHQAPHREQGRHGGPDLFQAEYQALPILVAAGAAADISRWSHRSSRSSPTPPGT